jgi:hypothetical protein
LRHTTIKGIKNKLLKSKAKITKLSSSSKDRQLPEDKAKERDSLYLNLLRILRRIIKTMKQWLVKIPKFISRDNNPKITTIMPKKWRRDRIFLRRKSLSEFRKYRNTRRICTYS